MRWMPHVQSCAPSGLRRHEGRWALFFLAPSLIGFLIFTAFPVLAALLLSLARWDLLSAPAFVGLGNYIQATKDPLFWRVLLNTIYYTVATVPLGIAVSLVFAVRAQRADPRPAGLARRLLHAGHLVHGGRGHDLALDLQPRLRSA